MMTPRSIKTCIIIVLFSLSLTFPPAVPRADGQSTSEIETSLQSRGARIKYSWQVRITIEALSAHRVPARGYAFLLNKGPALTAQFMLGGAPAVGANVSKEILLSTTRDLVGHPEKLSMAVANALWDEGLREYRENYRLYRKWSEQGSLSAVEMQTMDKNGDDSGKILLGKELFSDIHSYKYDKSQWEDTSKALLSKVAALGEISDQFETAMLAKELASIVAEAQDGLREYPPWQKHLERTAELVAENQLRGPLDDKDPGAGGRRTNPYFAGPTGELSDPQFWMNRAETLANPNVVAPGWSRHQLIRGHAIVGNHVKAVAIPPTAAQNAWITYGLELHGNSNRSGEVRLPASPLHFQEILWDVVRRRDVEEVDRILSLMIESRKAVLSGGDPPDNRELSPSAYSVHPIGSTVTQLLHLNSSRSFDAAVRLADAAFTLETLESEYPLAQCAKHALQTGSLAASERVLARIHYRTPDSLATFRLAADLAVAYCRSGEPDKADRLSKQYLDPTNGLNPVDAIKRITLAQAIQAGDVARATSLLDEQASSEAEKYRSGIFENASALTVVHDVGIARSLWNAGQVADAKRKMRDVLTRLHRMGNVSAPHLHFRAIESVVSALVEMNWGTRDIQDTVRKAVFSVYLEAESRMSRDAEIWLNRACYLIYHHCGFDTLLEFQKQLLAKSDIKELSPAFKGAAIQEFNGALAVSDSARAQHILRSVLLIALSSGDLLPGTGALVERYSSAGEDMAWLARLLDFHSSNEEKQGKDLILTLSVLLRMNVDAAVGLSRRQGQNPVSSPQTLISVAESISVLMRNGARITKDDNGNVTEVDLEGSKITDDGLLHLSSLMSLREVDLSDTSITDAGLVHLKGLSSLQRLRFVGTQLTGAGLLHLRGLSKLTHLNLGSTQITDEALTHLHNLSKLESLSLWHTEITDAGLMHLKHLLNLKGLWISGTNVTGDGLEYLRGLTDLKGLGLAFNQITDRDLEHLETLTELEELYLVEAQITDVGLVHLRGLVNLKDLNLSDTKVTKAGVAKLQKALPNCSISR